MDKFLWFYLPIIVMLVINSFIFVYIVVNVFRFLSNNTCIDIVLKYFRYRVTNKASGMADILTQKSVEEGVLYTKLFVGMGLNWYLEIVAWAMGAEMVETNWQVVPDCVNMLQVKFSLENDSLYIFSIFFRDSGSSSTLSAKGRF